MGLITCHICGGQIADDAVRCPHCGGITLFEKKKQEIEKEIETQNTIQQAKDEASWGLQEEYEELTESYLVKLNRIKWSTLITVLVFFIGSIVVMKNHGKAISIPSFKESGVHYILIFISCLVFFGTYILKTYFKIPSFVAIFILSAIIGIYTTCLPKTISNIITCCIFIFPIFDIIRKYRTLRKYEKSIESLRSESLTYKYSKKFYSIFALMSILILLFVTVIIPSYQEEQANFKKYGKKNPIEIIKTSAKPGKKTITIKALDKNKKPLTISHYIVNSTYVQIQGKEEDVVEVFYNSKKPIKIKVQKPMKKGDKIAVRIYVKGHTKETYISVK